MIKSFGRQIHMTTNPSPSTGDKPFDFTGVLTVARRVVRSLGAVTADSIPTELSLHLTDMERPQIPKVAEAFVLQVIAIENSTKTGFWEIRGVTNAHKIVELYPKIPGTPNISDALEGCIVEVKAIEASLAVFVTGLEGVKIRWLATLTQAVI